MSKILKKYNPVRNKIKIKLKRFLLISTFYVTQGGKGSSEGKKVQQILNWKFVIGMSKEFKFPKSKTIHEAILEIAFDTHSPFYPIWRIFLPLYYWSSIMASWNVLFFANLNSLDIPTTNFQVRICWSFFPSELPLSPWVITL